MSPPDYTGVEVVRGGDPSLLICFDNMSPPDYAVVEVVRGESPSLLTYVVDWFVVTLVVAPCEVWVRMKG